MRGLVALRPAATAHATGRKTRGFADRQAAALGHMPGGHTQQPRELLALAMRATWLLGTANQQFQLLVALFADVFVQRHLANPLKLARWPAAPNQKRCHGQAALFYAGDALV